MQKNFLNIFLKGYKRNDNTNNYTFLLITQLQYEIAHITKMHQLNKK